MATTYCNRLNIQSLIGQSALLACIDDNVDGVENPEETQYITDCITRAAVEMNEALCKQYVLSDLNNNDWCRWCNAYIAAWFLFERRGNPVPPGIIDAVQTYKDKLAEIRWGRYQVPQANPSFDYRPAVSNFVPELGKYSNPIRVFQDESTGGEPDPTQSGLVQRHKAFTPGWW